MFDLTGKTAVVTGGGSGIGAAVARVFAARGALLFLFDRDLGAAAGVAEEIRAKDGDARALRCDVSAADEVGASFARVAGEGGGPHTLVNNAGIAHVGDIEHTEEQDLDRLYQVNVKGLFLCARAALPLMVAQGGGVILNMASIASLIGIPDRFAYSMTKGAVHTMTMSIAVDYMRKGIRCNCICPARVHTPFVDGYLSAQYPGREQEMFQKLSEYQPLGRMGRPEEVAHLALYLCSDEAAFITGQAYPIDGGVLVT